MQTQITKDLNENLLEGIIKDLNYLVREVTEQQPEYTRLSEAYLYKWVEGLCYDGIFNDHPITENKRNSLIVKLGKIKAAMFVSKIPPELGDLFLIQRCVEEMQNNKHFSKSIIDELNTIYNKYK